MKRIFIKIFFILFFSVFSINLVEAEELQEVTIEHTDIFMDEIENVFDENETPFFDMPVLKQEIIFQQLGQPVVQQGIISQKDGKPFLKDKLHFEFEKGPIENLTVYSAYRSDFSFNFVDDEYHTKYQSGMIDLGIYGKFSEVPVVYRFSLNFKPIDGLNYLGTLALDNFITINAIKNHKIYVGHMRTPIGIEGGKSGYITPFLNRSQISRNFSNVRTLGVKVIGDYPLIDYNLGVYSSDRYFQKFFPGAEFTGWVNLKPLGKTDGKYGKVILGGGLNAGHKDYSYTVGGLYAGYEYKKLNLDFEYSAANGYNGVVVNSQNKANGFYATAAYKLTDKLQVLARYDQFVPNTEKSTKPQKEYTAGLNYFIKGQALKIMLNYVYYENFERNNGSRIYLGTQILL